LEEFLFCFQVHDSLPLTMQWSTILKIAIIVKKTDKMGKHLLIPICIISSLIQVVICIIGGLIQVHR
jgi:hypothetical protein